MKVSLPADWTPKVRMDRVIWHWTAGSYTPSSVDLKAYHFVIDGDGKWHKGNASIAKNSGSLKDGYAAHTLNLNTNSIGVSLACMAGAVESPFNPGKYPMRKVQMDSLIAGTRILCDRYGIAVSRKTTLSHAEVQPTLGVAQKQKWDFTRLAYDSSVKGAVNIGDMIRSKMTETSMPVESSVPLPTGAKVLTLAKKDTYPTPGTASPTGSIPPGVECTLLETLGSWVRLETPAGYKVWTSRADIGLVAGPTPTQPTKPHPVRELIEQVRDLLDAIEKAL